MNKQAKSYEDIAQHYDNILTARKWWSQFYMRHIWCVDDNAIAKDVLQMIPNDFKGHLLDVPVGTMVFTAEKYQHLSQAKITGLDYSQSMLDIAIKRKKEMKLSNLTLKQGDVLHLPFANNSFDGVLSMNGLHCFPCKENAISEIFRVLKPGGFFCGCFYIKGERKPADWIVRYILNKKGVFVPPHLNKYEAINLLKSFCDNNIITNNDHSIFVFRVEKR